MLPTLVWACRKDDNNRSSRTASHCTRGKSTHRDTPPARVHTASKKTPPDEVAVGRSGAAARDVARCELTLMERVSGVSGFGTACANFLGCDVSAMIVLTTWIEIEIYCDSCSPFLWCELCSPLLRSVLPHKKKQMTIRSTSFSHGPCPNMITSF